MNQGEPGFIAFYRVTLTLPSSYKQVDSTNWLLCDLKCSVSAQYFSELVYESRSHRVMGADALTEAKGKKTVERSRLD